MMIGLCGAELVRPESVGASQGFLGWVAYLGELVAPAAARWVVLLMQTALHATPTQCFHRRCQRRHPAQHDREESRLGLVLYRCARG